MYKLRRRLRLARRRPRRKGTGGRAAFDAPKSPALPEQRPKEIGGPAGPEPTRYGDWERKGICVDF
jgi:hypothetical protein